jgi:hypothetical protein
MALGTDAVESGRLFAHEPVDDLCAAYGRVVNVQAPTPASVDVLSVGLWQLCADGELADLACVLRFMRRCVAGSPWREATVDAGWADGFNLILGRVQEMVGRRYRARLPVRPLAAAAAGVSTGG